MLVSSPGTWRGPAPLRPLPAWKMASIASWQPRPGRKPYDLGSNPASHSGSSALATRACCARSAITGMPSGRRFPVVPRLGMYTRLTGWAAHGSVWCCSQSARSALSSGVSTTFLSTPAVMRPALSSVTRRTLTSVFDRDRSISFCRLRTRLRSPACDAVKIRCRSRRTFSSAARHCTASQPGGPPSGPFTTAAPAPQRRLTYPSVPASSPSSLSRAHLTRVSALSGPGISPVSGQLSKTAGGGASHHCPGFLLPFGCRHWLVGSSCSRSGTGPSLRSAYRARYARTRTGFPRSALRDTTGVGALSTPGTAVLSRPDAVPGRRLPLSSGQSLHPAATSHLRGLRFTRHQRRFTRFTRPACPSPVTTRMGRAALGLSPVLRTPPLPATHDRAGPGVSTRPELRDRHNRPSNPRVHSLSATSCRNGSNGRLGAVARQTVTPWSSRSAPHSPAMTASASSSTTVTPRTRCRQGRSRARHRGQPGATGRSCAGNLPLAVAERHATVRPAQTPNNLQRATAGSGRASGPRRRASTAGRQCVCGSH